MGGRGIGGAAFGDGGGVGVRDGQSWRTTRK